MPHDADAIDVGAGLAGLVATAELAAAGRQVIVVEQEPAVSLGGQAFWSFGGLFFVNSPEQRRMGIRDSYELALQDWLGSAGFDRPEDEWPRRWAQAYVAFAAGEKRAWLHARGVRFFRSSAGPSAVATTRADTATRFRAFTSRGERALASSTHSSARCAQRWNPASFDCYSGIASTSSPSPAAQSKAYAGASSRSPRSTAASRARAK